MKLLFLTTDFPTPWERPKALFNLYLARALARRHEVRVIAPVPWADELRAPAGAGDAAGPARREVLDGVPVYYPRYYYAPKVLRSRYADFYEWSIRRTLQGLLPEFRPDAVLSYYAHPDGEVGARLARRLGVPSAVIVGGSDVLVYGRLAGRRRCVQNALRLNDTVLTVNRHLRDEVVELGVPAEKVHVWHQGVDTDLFCPGDRAEARRRLGIPVEGRALLWVGRMVPVKGLDTLLAACTLLRDHGTAFRLYLVGEGPLQPALEAECKARRLSGAVTFVGPRLHDQLPDWYRAADLTLLPSRSEGLPNVLRESLACGTPFVASRVGGIPELAGGPANRLVPPDDAAALAVEVAQALAERRGAGPLPSCSTGWAESAAALVDVLRPLVAVSRVQKGHEAAAPVPAAGVPAPRSPWRPRQLLRRALSALLPRRLFLTRGPANSRSVCLTFDDGPHPEHTRRLLDVLREEAVPATFFLVGRQAERHPDLVRRMAAEGHAVAHHSYSHGEPGKTSAPELLAEVRRTRDLLTGLTGRPPCLFRPPKGALTARKLLGLWRAGQTIVLWNVDPKDYARRSPDEVRGWFRGRPLSGGDVVLMHDTHPHAAGVLPELIRAARDRGLTFTKLTEWTT